MKTKIDSAIELLAGKIASNDLKGDEALKLSQAALNLAHAAQVLSLIKEPPQKGVRL